MPTDLDTEHDTYADYKAQHLILNGEQEKMWLPQDVLSQEEIVEKYNNRDDSSLSVDLYIYHAALVMKVRDDTPDSEKPVFPDDLYEDIQFIEDTADGLNPQSKNYHNPEIDYAARARNFLIDLETRQMEQVSRDIESGAANQRPLATAETSSLAGVSETVLSPADIEQQIADIGTQIEQLNLGNIDAIESIIENAVGSDFKGFTRGAANADNPARMAEEAKTALTNANLNPDTLLDVAQNLGRIAEPQVQIS